MSSEALDIRVATPDRWADLESLFGRSGAYSGCWCMYFRLTGSEFQRNAGEPNRAKFRQIVESRQEPGLLAYDGARAVGWCAVCPRAELGRILRSPTLRPLDDMAGVWSVSCFYVARQHRRRGVSRALLAAAVEHCAERGAAAVEAYPIAPSEAVRAADAYPGTLALFSEAGFSVVEPRRSERRPVVRLRLRG